MADYFALLLYLAPFAVIWLCLDIMGITHRSRLKYYKKTNRTRSARSVSSVSVRGTSQIGQSQVRSQSRSVDSKKKSTPKKSLKQNKILLGHENTIKGLRAERNNILREHEYIYQDKVRAISEKVRADEDRRREEERERELRDIIETEERMKRDAEEAMLRERSERERLIDPPRW